MSRISDYRIVISSVAPDNQRRAARFLQDQIRLVTGKYIDVVTDATAPAALEIAVGKTSREPSGLIPERSRAGLYEYVIKSDGERVFICGLGTPADRPEVYNTAYRYVDDGEIGTLMGVYRFTECVLGHSFIYDGYSNVNDDPELEMPIPCVYEYTRTALKPKDLRKIDGTAMYMLPVSSDFEWNHMSFVLKTESGKLVVIDGGSRFETGNLLDVLDELSPDGEIPTVEAWFITHLHSDHYGALHNYIANREQFGDRVKVKRICCNFPDDVFYTELSREANPAWGPVLQTLRSGAELFGCEFHTVEVGEKIDIDELSFNIIHVPEMEHARDMNMNDSSIVMRLDVKGQRILFLSDAEWVCNNDLLENHRDEIRSDVVQVGHHGCGNVSRECYEAIGAQYYLWQIGNRFWYGEKGEGIGTHNTGVIRMRNWIRSFEIPEKNIILDKDHALSLELPIKI